MSRRPVAPACSTVSSRRWWAGPVDWAPSRPATELAGLGLAVRGGTLPAAPVALDPVLDPAPRYGRIAGLARTHCQLSSQRVGSSPRCLSLLTFTLNMLLSWPTCDFFLIFVRLFEMGFEKGPFALAALFERKAPACSRRGQRGGSSSGRLTHAHPDANPPQTNSQTQRLVDSQTHKSPRTHAHAHKARELRATGIARPGFYGKRERETDSRNPRCKGGWV